jgi:hypothetical protein
VINLIWQSEDLLDIIQSAQIREEEQIMENIRNEQHPQLHAI